MASLNTIGFLDVLWCVCCNLYFQRIVCIVLHVLRCVHLCTLLIFDVFHAVWGVLFCVWTVVCRVWSVFWAVCSVHWRSFCCVQCALCSVQYESCSVQCALCSVLCCVRWLWLQTRRCRLQSGGQSPSGLVRAKTCHQEYHQQKYHVLSALGNAQYPRINVWENIFVASKSSKDLLDFAHCVDFAQGAG